MPNEPNEKIIRNTCLLLCALTALSTLTICHALYGDKNSEVPESRAEQTYGLKVWHESYDDTRAAQAAYLEGRTK